MKAIYTSLAFVIYLSSYSLVHSQSPGGGAGNPDNTIDQSAPAINEKPDVKADIDKYLSNKGWQRGENTKSNGEKFFIVAGVGIIQAPRGSSGYIDSRRRAFDKAMIEAKGKLLRYLETTIKTKTDLFAQEGNAPNASGALSLSDKVDLMAFQKVRELLQAKGIDPNSPEAKKHASDLIATSESFQKFVQSASQSYIAGIQAFKVFEGSPNGAKGRIGVVAIWSDKLAATASAITTGQRLPPGKGKKSIKEQIPTDNSVLLATFGVRQMRDENGNPILVSFSQAGPKSKSALAEEFAEERAVTMAEAYIREFAGENAKRVTDIFEAETTVELEDGSEIYKDDSAMTKAISAMAEAMKINGISEIHRWNGIHPLTNQKVFGRVLAWSPDLAASARLMKSRINSVQQARPGVPGGVTGKGNKNNQSGSFSAGGIDGDEDDF